MLLETLVGGGAVGNSNSKDMVGVTRGGGYSIAMAKMDDGGIGPTKT